MILAPLSARAGSLGQSCGPSAADTAAADRRPAPMQLTMPRCREIFFFIILTPGLHLGSLLTCPPHGEEARSAVSNHGPQHHPSRRGQEAAPQDEAHFLATSLITASRSTRRQSISYSRSTTGGRAKCQVRPERTAPWRTSSSAITG